MSQDPVKEAIIRLKNARKELEQLRSHEDDESRTYHALAMGVLDNAIQWLTTGKVLTRKGLHSAILASLSGD